MTRNASLLLLCLFLGACQSGYGRSPVVTPQRMTCAGDIPAAVTLYSPTEAKLTFEDRSYDLNRIETASGVKYGNSDIAFWNRGIDATIVQEDGRETSCTYVPQDGL